MSLGAGHHPRSHQSLLSDLVNPRGRPNIESIRQAPSQFVLSACYLPKGCGNYGESESFNLNSLVPAINSPASIPHFLIAAAHHSGSAQPSAPDFHHVCESIAGPKREAEAFSGLPRAFFIRIGNGGSLRPFAHRRPEPLLRRIFVLRTRPPAGSISFPSIAATFRWANLRGS